MRQEDRVALEIEADLRESFNELSHSVGEYANVIGVFYHQLIAYFTNYYLIRNSKEHVAQISDFPFLSTDFIKSPRLLNFEPNRVGRLTYKKRLLKGIDLVIEVLSSMRNTNLRVGLCNSPVLSYQLFLNLKQIKIRMEKGNLLYLPELEFQLHFLENTISEFCKKFDVSHERIYIANFVNYARRYVTKKQIKVDNDWLIIGSACGTSSLIMSRINAANYKFSDKMVIALAHGANSFLEIDEPIVGYGELSYCDYYVNFGKPFDVNRLKYVKPLQKQPKIVYKSEKLIERYYSGNKIKFRKLDKNIKIAYLPTGFSQNERSGPFRDHEDCIYRKWQESILKFDLDIIYKRHPLHMGVQINAKKIEKRPLQDCVREFDFFIIDHFATAQAYAAATDKPIIYFNLGLRNISSEILPEFKKRVFWIDIDILGSHEDQIIKAFEAYNNYQKDFVNSYTEKSSLSNTGNSAIDCLNEILFEPRD